MIVIDEAQWPSHGRVWCHLASDTSFDELHSFAASVGIPERAFDGDHYDVPEERRADVITAGAVAVNSRDLVARLRSAGLRRPQLRSAKRERGGPDSRQ
jgi:hypothetical protein